MLYNYIPIFSLSDKPDTLAHWNWDYKFITVFLKSVKRVFGHKPDLLDDAISYLINHETLHGVIQHQLEKDKWSGQFNAEFPIDQAMHDDYKRVCKRLE